MGDKPGQITREAIAEAEAAEDLADDDVSAGNPSDWDYDKSTEGDDEYNRVSFDDAEDENPPTPILDAYEKSRDPAEMERLIKMSFESLPERAGPQRYNHKRREHQRYKTIRVSVFVVCCLRASSTAGKLCSGGMLLLETLGRKRRRTSLRFRRNGLGLYPKCGEYHAPGGHQDHYSAIPHTRCGKILTLCHGRCCVLVSVSDYIQPLPTPPFLCRFSRGCG